MTDYNELIERLEKAQYEDNDGLWGEAVTALRELQKERDEAWSLKAHQALVNRAEAAELKVEQLQSALNVANADKRFFERRCKELSAEIEELYYPNRQ